MNILDKNDLPKRKLPAIPEFSEGKESSIKTVQPEGSKIIPQKNIISAPPPVQISPATKNTKIEAEVPEALEVRSEKNELDWRQYLGLCHTNQEVTSQRELIESFNTMRENHHELNLNLILLDHAGIEIKKVLIAFQEMNSILKRFKLKKDTLVLVYLYKSKLEFIVDGVIDDYFSYSHPIFRVYPFKAERGRGWCIEFNATFKSTREGNA